MTKKTKPRTKHKNITTLKNEALRYFQAYRRKSDAITRGDGENVSCISCGNVFNYKEMDGGHFVGRACNFLAFHEDNVFAQCKGCNCFKYGNVAEYYRSLVHILGQEKTDWLLDNKNTSKKFIRYELEELLFKYKTLCKEIDV